MTSQRLLLGLLLVLFVGPAVAQTAPTATLTGLVRDRATQEPLIGASVSLENTTLGTAADVEGRFRLTSIPPGNYNVRVQAVGYRLFTRFNVSITSGNAALGPNDGGNVDVVAMDDFIFAEVRRTVPEPSTLLLLGAAALALRITRRRG